MWDENSHGYPPTGPVSDASLLSYYNLPTLPMYSDTGKIHYYISLYYTFNTRANRVAIVCPMITKIFNPVQLLDGHISTFFH
jgi:hypothetical protein